MDDAANLNIGVKYGSVEGAQQALDRMSDSSRKTGSATRELYSHMDSLTRAMDKMVETQRRTNQLVLDGVRAQQETARSTEQNISSMTRLTVGLNAASVAWDMFRGASGRAVEHAAATTQQMNALASSLDAVLNRFKQLQSQNFDLGKLVSTAAFGFGNSVLGAPYQSGPPMGQMEQMSALIQAAALRSGLSGTSLLRGANIGSSLGVGTQGGVEMTATMQRNLNGMSLEALQAQRTMHDFGVTTTDTVKALKEFLTALVGTKDDARRLANLQAVLPGADPGILTRSTIAMLNPPQRSEAAYQQSQSDEIARLRAINADILDRNRARTLGSTMFMGVRQSFGDAAGSPANMARDEALKNMSAGLFDSLLENVFGSGTMRGAGADAAGLAANFGRRLSNAVSGLTLGIVPPPLIPDSRDERGTGPRSAEERQLLRSYEIRLGRQSTGALSERMTEERMAGANLVRKGLLDPAQFDQDMGRLAEMLRKLADPVSHMVELLQDQSRLSGMPGAQRQTATLIQQAGRIATQSGREGVDAKQIQEIERSVETERVGRGTELARQSKEQLGFTQSLTRAYAEGGGAAQRLTAAEAAHKEVIDGLISKTQEASRASSLLAQSLAEMVLAEQKALVAGGIENTATGMRAGAAGGGPVALRRAEIQAQVYKQFAPDLKAAQDAYDNAKSDEELARASEALAAVRRNAAEREAQLTKDAENQAREQGDLARRGTEQRLRDYGIGGAASAGGGPGAIPWSQARGMIKNRESMGGQNVRNYRYDATHTAQGELQITDQTWKQFAPPEIYARWQHAMDAPSEIQDKVGELIYNKRGFQPWTGSGNNVWNPKLAADVARMGGGGGSLLGNRFESEARQGLERRGQPFTPEQQSAEARRLATEATLDQLTGAAERRKDTERVVELDKQMADAIAKGVQAEKDLNAQIQIEEQFRRATEAAQKSGNADLIKAVELEKQKSLELERQKQAAQVSQAVAREQRGFNLEQKNTQLEIDALKNGGQGAMAIQSRANSISSGLIAQGVPEDQARQIAEQQAKAAQAADDYKNAILEASNELKNGLKEGLNSIVDGLSNAVGKSAKWGDTLRGILKDLDKVGLNLFVKGPLNKMLSNAVEGKGFTTGAGGHSGSDIQSSAFGGLFKSLGLGGSSDSDSDSKSSRSSYSSSDADYGGNDYQTYHSGGRVIRLHDGGDDFSLASDEVPAVLQEGEYVLNRDEAAHYQAALGEFGANPQAMWSAVRGVGSDISEGVGKASMGWLGQYNDALSGKMLNEPMGGLRSLAMLGLATPASSMNYAAGFINRGGDLALDMFNTSTVSALPAGMQVPTSMAMAKGFEGGLDALSASSKALNAAEMSNWMTAGSHFDASSGAFVDGKGNHWYHNGGLVKRYHDGGEVTTDDVRDKNTGIDFTNLGGTLLAAGVGGGIGYGAADTLGSAIYGRYWNYATKDQKQGLRQELAMFGGVAGAAAKMLFNGLKDSKGSDGNLLSRLFGGDKTPLGRALFGKKDTASSKDGGSSSFGGMGSTDDTYGNPDYGNDYSDPSYGADYGGNSYGSDYAMSDAAGWDSGFGGGGDGFGFGGGFETAAIAHTGGRIEDLTSSRSVAAGYFAGAPRLHGGGLMPDEVPVIAQKGERMLSREENRDYERGARPGSTGNVTINQSIYTPDAHSFRASAPQTAAAAQAAQRRAMRAS